MLLEVSSEFFTMMVVISFSPTTNLLRISSCKYGRYAFSLENQQQKILSHMEPLHSDHKQKIWALFYNPPHQFFFGKLVKIV